MHARSPSRKTSSSDQEVFFEFRVIGNAVKLSAVDAASGVEVAVMGPAAGSHEELKSIALRKLQKRLSEQS